MANNRLYIHDINTGEELLVAKSFGNGWSWLATEELLDEWLIGRDQWASYGVADEMSMLTLRAENDDH